MKSVALTGLLKIELPERTLRFSDGGFIIFQGETYRSKDAVFGTIGGAQPLNEGVGDSVPALQITLLPPDTTGPAALSRPGHQKARVRFWVAEYNPETNARCWQATSNSMGRSTRPCSLSDAASASWPCRSSAWPSDCSRGISATRLSPNVPQVGLARRTRPRQRHRADGAGRLGRRELRRAARGQRSVGRRRRFGGILRNRPACFGGAGVRISGGNIDASRTRTAAGRHGKDAGPLPREGVRLARAGSPASTSHASSSRTMGHTPPTLPRIRSALGAKKALRAQEWGSVVAMLDALLERIAPAADDAGRSGGRAGRGRQTRCDAGLRRRPLKVFGWREDAEQLVVLDIGLDELSGAWRV